MKFGFHVSLKGGIGSTLPFGASHGCETIQIFAGNPRQWAGLELEPDVIESFHSARRQTGIDPVFFHSIYLVNLASTDEHIHQRSISSLVSALDAADMLGVAGVVTHIGNHKGRGLDFGVERIAQSTREILDRASGKAHLILETTAGAGTSIGYRFEQLEKIIRLAGSPERVGVCFDTCHVFAAGYDISSSSGLERTLEEFDGHLGLFKLEVVHANDSRGKCGSRVDRHENIGDGRIGIEGFRALVNNQSLRHLPCILETPHRSDEDDPRNLRTLRSLVE